jgi:3-oxoacyl-(acyl-carrier-protein) synthase
MAKFSHYAIAAARQAIQDAQWTPETDLEKQRTVSIVKLNLKHSYRDNNFIV